MPAFVLTTLFLCLAGTGESGPRRTMAYAPGGAEAALAWQQEVRSHLFDLLHLRDLLEAPRPPLEPEVLRSEPRDGYRLEIVRLRSTPGRTMTVAVAFPDGAGPFPGLVALHGHGGAHMTPFDPDKPQYRLFGEALVRAGFVVVSPDVGQHAVYEPGRTLMGERVWDCMRCVDYLVSLPGLDAARVACAGLSLGGEMAMWLGAMDPRVVAVGSCGFLTRMDQLEENHCPCWKFPGLRGAVDFADIYALIAPRALMCQNGRAEPPSQFPPDLAADAMAEIRRAYADLGSPDGAVLHIHDGGHEIDLPALVRFLEDALRLPEP
jgi:hypothetical protein